MTIELAFALGMIAGLALTLVVGGFAIILSGSPTAARGSRPAPHPSTWSRNARIGGSGLPPTEPKPTKWGGESR